MTISIKCKARDGWGLVRGALGTGIFGPRWRSVLIPLKFFHPPLGQRECRCPFPIVWVCPATFTARRAICSSAFRLSFPSALAEREARSHCLPPSFTVSPFSRLSQSDAEKLTVFPADKTALAPKSLANDLNQLGGLRFDLGHFVSFFILQGCRKVFQFGFGIGN